MPLFGSHKNTTEARTGGRDPIDADPNYMNAAGRGGAVPNMPMNAGGGVHPGQAGLHSAEPGYGGAGYGNTGAASYDERVGGAGYGSGVGAGGAGAGVPHGHVADTYPATAAAGGHYPADAGRGVSAAGEPGIPPAHAINTSTSTHGSSGSAFAGKVEQAVGTLLSSQSMKAKGLQKEEEARALKAQSRELTAAENLEREAAMRRERAVAHGAHPDNRHVGGRPL